MCNTEALEFLRAKNEELQVRIDLLLEAIASAKRRAASYELLWDSCCKREGMLEDVVRGMLNEIPYDEDDRHTRSLRAMLWNDSDTKSRNECEKRGD